MELYLLRDFLLLPRVLSLVHEGLDLRMRHLQHSLDYVRGARDYVLNIVLADLIVQFLQDLLCIAQRLLLSVVQLASLVAAEVVAV